MQESCSNPQDSASLLVCNDKVFRFFVGNVVSGIGFLAILAHVAWPWAQMLDVSILLKFILQTRLESECFIL